MPSRLLSIAGGGYAMAKQTGGQLTAEDIFAGAGTSDIIATDGVPCAVDLSRPGQRQGRSHQLLSSLASVDVKGGRCF